MVKVVVFDGVWKEEDPLFGTKTLWLYTDNDSKEGKTGQDVIRDHPNTCGIPTKKFSTKSKSSCYTDDEYEENKKKIVTAFKRARIMIKVKGYDTVILPIAGFGRDLKKAPQTLLLLNQEMRKFVDEMNREESEKRENSEVEEWNVV